MLRSLYTAATGMSAQETKLDVIANNLANSSTVGFKKTSAQFADLLSETMHAAQAPDARSGGSPEPMQVGLGVRTAGVTRLQTQGDLLNTGNATDVAIQGNGYFRVQQANGDYAYTRAGSFHVDANGKLTTLTGEVIDPGITIPSSMTNLTIGADGTVTATVAGQTQPNELGQITLSTFVNPSSLQSIGNNLMVASAGSGQPTQVKPGDQGTGTLAQGFLENANVQAVTEMVDMISAQRAYELNSKVIQTADQMLQKLTTLR
jgi:flagellar basal-body rod protein FlgG